MGKPNHVGHRARLGGGRHRRQATLGLVGGVGVNLNVSTGQAAADVVVGDGMRIEWDVPIQMDDGVILRADIFRPLGDIPAPALLTYGPYGKGMRFPEHHPEQWERLVDKRPEVLIGSSNKYQAWETPDPERWVPHGYAYVRVDSRGAGRSPGFLAPHSFRETLDAARCVDWAGSQPWCNGNVGMLGISYYACISWRVAALESAPRHLAAVCAWEGNADPYRDASRHGGILTTWSQQWWQSRILTMQHGLGERGPRNPNNGRLVTGDDTLSVDELRANRMVWAPHKNPHVLADDWWQSRAIRWDNVRVPILSAGNWGGAALHLRGNTEAFVRAAAKQKWLEIHGQEHWTEFYSGYGLDIQRRFMDAFLKAETAGWKDQAPVVLNVRHPGEKYTLREEADWPIPDTQWTRWYLDARSQQLALAPSPARCNWSFDAIGEGIRFLSEPLTRETEITGPIAVRLYISSTTADADLFVVVHVFDPEGEEITFQGAMDPYTSIGKGWLRASQRKLDAALTREYRPYHAHDQHQALTPGAVYGVDIEVWPTSIVVPARHRIGLSVLGRDYLRPPSGSLDSYESFGQQLDKFGSGGMLHDDPDDRPAATYAGQTTIHTGLGQLSSILLPIIPPRDAGSHAPYSDQTATPHPQQTEESK
jgi:uncharacterized protein